MVDYFALYMPPDRNKVGQDKVEVVNTIIHSCTRNSAWL